MGLQFILSKHIVQERPQIYKKIKADLEADPNLKVFYLVPENMKFQMEKDIIQAVGRSHPKYPELKGMYHLEVFSFKRLYWYLSQGQILNQSNVLSELGQRLVLKKILLDYQDDLNLYRGEVNQDGFIDLLVAFLNELMQGNISSLSLERLLGELDPQGLNQRHQHQQLEELLRIYKAYEERVNSDYHDPLFIQEQFLSLIDMSDWSNTVIYLDGFYHYSGQELEVIQALLEKVSDLKIVLPLNHGYPSELPDQIELFYLPGRAYHLIYQMAKTSGQKIYQDQYLSLSQAKEGQKLALDVWEHSRSLGPSQKLNTQNHEQIKDYLAVYEAKNPQNELEFIANKIYQLVHDQGYRYQDIQVLYRDFEAYQEMIGPIFDENQIPYFVSESSSMAHHPLSRFFKSLYGILTYHWRYQETVSLMKTELLVPIEFRQDVSGYREAVDLTDNTILKYGYEGRAWWNSNREWIYHTINEDRPASQGASYDEKIAFLANRMKSYLVEIIDEFEALLEKSETYGQAIPAIYQFLLKHGVEETVNHWRLEAIDADDLVTARKHEQAWQTMVNIFDEIMQVFEDEVFDYDTFSKILTTAFEEAEYDLVPTTLDSVLLDNFVNQRPGQKKITFVIGMTHKVLPKQRETASLLSQDQRQALDNYLEPTQSLSLSLPESLAHEPLIMYDLLQASSDYLYLSYPSNILDGENQGSPYVEAWMSQAGLDKEALSANDQGIKALIGSPRASLRNLTKALSLSQKDKRLLEQDWQKVYQALSYEDFLKQDWLSPIDALTDLNTVTNLSKDLAKRLYGETLRTSVSQLELYNQDPFSYFLRYGLKLKEREEFSIDALSIGSYFHDILEYTMNTVLKTEQENQAELTKAEKQAVLMAEIERRRDEEVFPEYAVFASNPRHLYLRRRIEKTADKSHGAVDEQLRLLGIENLANELGFGPQMGPRSVPGLEFDLSNGGKMVLRGKVDRIDGLIDPVSPLLQVIDYKSGVNKFSYQGAYYGLDLQLITYLEVALQTFEAGLDYPFKPVGAYYMRLQDDFIPIKTQADLEDINHKRFEKYKLSGLIVNDQDLLAKVDPMTEEGSKSLILPYALNKNGSLKKTDNWLTEEEMENLRQFNLAKIQETANRIANGDIQLSPLDYEYSQYILSLTDHGRAVSLFDPQLKENKYRIPEKINKEEFFKRISPKVEEEEDDQ